MTPERGFAARWLRLFPFPLKIHFKGRQLPAGRGFFKISFALVIRATGFWQPRGREFFLSLPTPPRFEICQTKRLIFSLLLTTDKNQKCQTPGQKNFPFTYYYNPNRAKWPGTEPGNKKAANLFQTYCFHWPRRWRLVFSFENSFHIGMINGELLRYIFKRKRFLLEYIPQNMQSLYLSQCNIYIVFQQ